MNKKLYPYYESQQYKMHQDNKKIQSISRIFFKDSILRNIMKSLHINCIIKIILILLKKKKNMKIEKFSLHFLNIIHDIRFKNIMLFKTCFSTEFREK